MPTKQILITPVFRMSFPNLVEPRAYQDKKNSEPRYSVEMIFDPEDMGKFKTIDDNTGEFVETEIAKVCARVAKKEWGLDVKAAVKNKELGWPVKSGDAHADARDAKGKKNNDHYRGKKVMNAKANAEYPPRLLYKESGEKKQLQRGFDSEMAKAKQMFAGGHYAFAEITVSTTTSGDDKYVTVYLNSIMFVKEGERLGGSSMMDRFDGVYGSQEEYDPTAGADDVDDDFNDEIPF